MTMPIPSRLHRLRRLLAPALLVLPLLACHTPIDVHGNEPDPQAVTQIIPGHSTKADVTELLGSPTSVSTFDPNTWYYISRRMLRSSFSDPKLVSQKIYVVEFNNDGVVTGLETHLNDAHKVPMIARTTPAPGRELTVLQQLLGNFGRFNKTDTSDKDSGSGSGSSDTGS